MSLAGWEPSAILLSKKKAEAVIKEFGDKVKGAIEGNS